MEKEKTLKAIANMMRDSGLSPDDIVSYWQKIENPAASKESAMAPQYHAPKGVLPGMYVYADGLISPELIKERQIKAVVGYVKGSEVLAVCLRKKRLCWSDAVQYCRDYAEDGVQQGEALLPSITELEWLCDNKDKINESLSKQANATVLKERYWSSTEYDAYQAWKLSFASSSGSRDGKNLAGYVRPVISFKL